MSDDGYITPEGFWLPQELLLPDARAFSDVLEYVREWDGSSMSWRGASPPSAPVEPRIIHAGEPSGNYYASTGASRREGNEIGPYCTIDLAQLGGKAHRSIAVRATDAVIEAVTPRIVTPDDQLSFRLIGHHRAGRVLVILEHGYIIGGHWLAYIDPETIPAVPED